jgi:hypothetical protein
VGRVANLRAEYFLVEFSEHFGARPGTSLR